MELLKAKKEDCDLIGPYECPSCHGHLMVDVTYIEQVKEEINCPYCGASVTLPAEDLGPESDREIPIEEEE